MVIDRPDAISNGKLDRCEVGGDSRPDIEQGLRLGNPDDGRGHGAYGKAPAGLAADDTGRSNGDDHRTPRTDLGERLRVGRRRMEPDAGDELARLPVVALRAQQEFGNRHRSLTTSERAQVHSGVGGKQEWQAVACRTCRAEVPAEGGHIPDLR